MKSVTDSGGFDSPPSLAPPPPRTTSTKDTERNQRRRRGWVGVGGRVKEGAWNKSISGVVRAGGGGGCHNLFEVYTLPPLSFFPLKSSLPLPFVSSLPLPRPHLFSPCGKKTLGRRIYASRLQLRLSIPLACPEDSHNPPPLSVTITPKSSLWLLADVWNPPNFVNRLMQ